MNNATFKKAQKAAERALNCEFNMTLTEKEVTFVLSPLGNSTSWQLNMIDSRSCQSLLTKLQELGVADPEAQTMWVGIGATHRMVLSVKRA